MERPSSCSERHVIVRVLAGGLGLAFAFPGLVRLLGRHQDDAPVHRERVQLDAEALAVVVLPYGLNAGPEGVFALAGCVIVVLLSLSVAT